MREDVGMPETIEELTFLFGEDVSDYIDAHPINEYLELEPMEELKLIQFYSDSFPFLK